MADVCLGSLIRLRRGRAEPALDLFRILLVERVGEFAQRMAQELWQETIASFAKSSMGFGSPKSGLW